MHSLCACVAGSTQPKRCVNVDCEGLVTPPKPRGISKRNRCRLCYDEYRASYKSENQVELVAEASKPRTREASKRQRDPQSTPQTSGNTTALLADTGGKRIRQVLPVIEEVQQQPPVSIFSYTAATRCILQLHALLYSRTLYHTTAYSLTWLFKPYHTATHCCSVQLPGSITVNCCVQC